MKVSRLLPVAGLVIATIGFSSGAEAACTFTGKGSACKGGLSAMARLVTDPDWRAKWNTSVETTPVLTGSDKLGNGDKGTLLTFVSAEKAGMLELKCDLKVKLPDGKVEQHRPQLCFKGEVVAGNIYLTGMEIGLEGDGEPGKAEFTVGVVHARNGTRLPLKTIVEFTK
ncbi:MAG: hypothetical protein JWQ89_110 [Devosia sp.]|uniref:hypothetical protein n=1 Tax=Devosia sp. TaxID=1871048 RepID=UPI0026025143|nr:hypothetical protein [Devosia sp.]MDB5538383.1 hypothetical protein [Devosia sp.]